MPQIVEVKGFGKVNFPDDMSADQIQFVIESDIIPQLSKATEGVISPEKPSGLVSAGRGAQDVLDRISQLAINSGEKMGMLAPGIGDIATSQMLDEQKKYEGARGPDAGFDIYRTGGNAGMLAPVALMPGGQGFLGRAASGAAQGGTAGFLQFDPSNTAAGTLKNTAVSAAAGAALNPAVGFLGDKVAKGVKNLIGRFRGVQAGARGRIEPTVILEQIPEAKALPRAQQQLLLQDAIDQMKATGEFDVEGLRRRANLIANNLTATKSMVTRSPRDWTIERNLQKMAQSQDPRLSSVGEELTSVYQQNDAALTNQLRSQAAGLPKATQEAQGEAVMRGVDKLAREKQSKVGEAYDAVRGEDFINQPPNALVERLFSADLQDIEDPAVKTVIKTVENRLKRNGVVKSTPTVGPDGSYSFELTGKGMTAKQTEELRKLLNGLDTPGNAGRVKSQIIRALDESITREGGQDLYGAARAQAAQRFESLDNPAAQRALDTLGELQQGKTAQNFIEQQVVGAADQDVSALVKTLEGNKDALDAMKAGVLQWLEEKAVNVNSGQFSGAAFNKALESIGDTKLRAVLGEQTAQKLKSLSRAALNATYQPPYSAVNASNTSPMLLSATTNLRKIPVIGGLVTDETQGAIQASAARKQLADALSRRGNAPLIEDSRQVQSLVEALRAMSAPSAAASLDQRGKPANKKAKDR